MVQLQLSGVSQMVEKKVEQTTDDEEVITSTIFCVNTNFAYVYELLHGDIVREKKVAMKT